MAARRVSIRGAFVAERHIQVTVRPEMQVTGVVVVLFIELVDQGIRRYGGDYGIRLPTHVDMGWAAQTWKRAIDPLLAQGIIETNPQGTFLATDGPYVNLHAFRMALTTGSLVVRPLPRRKVSGWVRHGIRENA